MLQRNALVLFLGLLGCGGKAVIDGTLGAGGTGGGGSTSSTTSSGGGGGSGGCDVASHTIDIADFNVSCAVPSDCIPVFIGNFCSSCRCPFAAINVADQTKYDAEKQIKEAGAPPFTCNCPAANPTCVQGKCETKTP